MAFQVVKLVDTPTVNVNLLTLSSSPTLTAVIFGDGITNGSWRIIESGNNLSIQRLEGGNWIEKSAVVP